MDVYEPYPPGNESESSHQNGKFGKSSTEKCRWEYGTPPLTAQRLLHPACQGGIGVQVKEEVPRNSSMKIQSLEDVPSGKLTVVMEQKFPHLVQRLPLGKG